MHGALQNEHLAAYQQNGYVVVRRLFDAGEIGLLHRAAREDLGVCKDGKGNQIGLADWNEPGDGIYGMFARCERLVNVAERLLGGEVYHYHSRMVMKDPNVGGAWPWHQDYAYWYYDGVLRPLLVSAFVAIDPSTRANGCLQVIEGTHDCGRIDHLMVGDRIGADRDRVEELLKRTPATAIGMSPGDVLFFHCNLLHCSGRNPSQQPRWSLICVYNAARNDPYCDSRHPRYTPLKKVTDHAVRAVGRERFIDTRA